MNSVIWEKYLEQNNETYRIRQTDEDDAIVEIKQPDGSWSADLADGVCALVYMFAVLDFKKKADST